MKLAVHCANLSWPGGPAALGQTLAGVARAADQGGVATVTLMDHYFPGGGWIRLDRETIDALVRYRSERGLTSWESTLAELLPTVVTS